MATIPIRVQESRVQNNIFSLAVLVVFAVLGSILYSRTLHVPWLFDDIQNVADNPLIRDLGVASRHIGDARGVAFLSFALNYHFAGLELQSFHAVNIAIHIGSSWLAFLIMRRIFSRSFFLAFAGALIFLVHPLQTQAVNYVVQRMASMCGFFMLAAVYFYICFRQKDSGGKGEVTGERRGARDGEGVRTKLPASALTSRVFFYMLSLSACVLALWTKQNAVVLPAALLMVDRYFCNPSRGGWKRILLYLLPFILVTTGNASQQLREHRIVLKEARLAQYWAKANETSSNLKVAEKKGVSLVKPPKNLQAIYFVTELSALWLYIRLLFVPVGQIFDYGYPLVSDMVTLQNGAALLGHLLLLGLAVWLRNRRPLISFGIFWFYLTLVVESSVIPLDAVMEHRLYLTVFGFALVLLDLVRLVPWRKMSATVTVTAIVAFAALCWQRNALWADTIAFAEDNVKKAPHNQRNYLSLATAYADGGRWRDAERTLKAAIKMRPDYPVTYENLGSALAAQGRYPEAINFFQMALNLSPENPNILFNAGLVLVRMGDATAAQAVVERLKAANFPLTGQLETIVAGMKQ